MLTFATLCLCAAALGGALLTLVRLRGGNPPLAIASVHGAAGAVGILTLGIVVVRDPQGGLVTALVLFALAAVLGFGLLRIHRTGRLLPLPMIAVHALLALTGLALLLREAF